MSTQLAMFEEAQAPQAPTTPEWERVKALYAEPNHSAAVNWLDAWTYHHEPFPNALLFIRIGNFYETFWEDAETVAKECGLTLTARKHPTDPRMCVPMCGCPAHAMDRYTRLLVEFEYEVQIVEGTVDHERPRA